MALPWAAGLRKQVAHTVGQLQPPLGGELVEHRRDHDLGDRATWNNVSGVIGVRASALA